MDQLQRDDVVEKLDDGSETSYFSSSEEEESYVR